MRTTRIGHRLLMPFFACVFAVAIGCSSSSDPAVQSFELYTELESGSSVPVRLNGEIQVEDDDEFADSVRIDSVRVLFSRLVLHRSKDDTTEGPRKVKAGPFVLTWSARGMRRNLGADIEPGLFRRMKLEMHKFSGSEATMYSDDAVFRDFTTGKRSTMIVDGVVFVDGEAQPFRVTSERTGNVFVEFEPPVEVTESGTQSVVMSMDMIASLKVTGGIRNPRLPKTLEAIEAAIWTTTKIRKR